MGQQSQPQACEGWRDRLPGLLPPRQPLRVLEAGGGSATHVPLPPSAIYTVIDISIEQLERNEYAVEKLHGDIETFDFEDRRFDVIVCYDVLEHLLRPRKALLHLTSILAEEGILILAGPIVSSMKGLVTKFTPHFVHVWFYRSVLKNSRSGQPGYPPFKTSLKFDADPLKLRKTLESANIVVVHYEELNSVHVDIVKKELPFAFMGLQALSTVLRIISGGRFGSEAADFILVGRKRTLRSA